LKLVPTVVDEFDGFERVVRGEVLGNIISVVRSVPLNGSFYVGREVVVGSAGYQGSLVVQGEGDL
jgi:hypothetical protein